MSQGCTGQGEGPALGCDLDIVSPGTIAHNELHLTGWAASPDGVTSVVVQVGDRLLNATYGLETPWVAESMPAVESARRSGYSLRLDTSTWEPGARLLTVAAFDGQGRRSEIVGQIEVLPFEPPQYTVEDNRAALAEGKVAMWLEEPRIAEGNSDATSPLEVAGWAHSNAGLQSVMITIDGRGSHQALRPIVRPDLLEGFGPAAAAGAGFALRLHPSECPPGRHTLAVVAIGTDGSAVGIEGEIECRGADEEDDSAAGSADLEIDWIADATAPRRRQPSGDTLERFDPSLHAGSVIESEHQLRYRWAMAVAEGKSVLDAACGVGWGTVLLAEAGAKQVTGIDLSDEAIAEARRRSRGLPVELERADLRELPFEDARFDLITCFETIEHIEDPDLALEELRRVLKPDGVLLISTPRRRRWPVENEYHVHEYTPGEFERALRDRFANVSLHRQQTRLASTLVDDGALAGEDGATDLEIEVRKLADERPGGETYTVAAAGDGPLPELGRMAMLASPHAVFQVHMNAHRWQSRALLAEADAAASRVEAELGAKAQAATLRQLAEANERLAADDAARDEARAEAYAARDEARAEVDEARDEARAEVDAMRAERDAARAEVSTARDELAALDAELALARKSLTEADERQSEKTDALLSELADAQRRLADQEERLAQQARLLDAQATDLAGRKLELRVGEERLQSAEAELHQWRSSRSVRATRPLRAAMSRLGRVRHRIRRPGLRRRHGD